MKDLLTLRYDLHPLAFRLLNFSQRRQTPGILYNGTRIIYFAPMRSPELVVQPILFTKPAKLFLGERSPQVLQQFVVLFRIQCRFWVRIFTGPTAFQIL